MKSSKNKIKENFSLACSKCGDIRIFSSKGHLKRAKESRNLCYTCAAIISGANPDTKRKRSESIKKSWEVPDRAEKGSIAMKKWWAALSLEERATVKNNMSAGYRDSEERRENSRQTTLKQFADPVFYSKFIEIVNTKEHTRKMRENMLAKINDPNHKINSKEVKEKKSESFKKTWNNSPDWQKQALKNLGLTAKTGNGTSKLEIWAHKNIACLGFLHKATIAGYCVDIIHEKYKLIIEINGDFWHANPAIYSFDWINNVNKLSAQQIWDRDAKRIKDLNDAGYEVIILWQKDIKNPKKFDIAKFVKEEMIKRNFIL